MPKAKRDNSRCIAGRFCRNGRNGNGAQFAQKRAAMCDGTDSDGEPCKRWACKDQPVCMKHLETHKKNCRGVKHATVALSATLISVLGAALILHLGDGSSQAALARTDRLLAQPDHIMQDSSRQHPTCDRCKVALGAFEYTDHIGSSYCSVCDPLVDQSMQEVSLWSQR